MITIGLTRRLAGQTWVRAAAACTADGQLEPSILIRWSRRFRVEHGILMEIDPPAAPIRDGPERAILLVPAERRVPDPTQEDPWVRGPPLQP